MTYVVIIAVMFFMAYMQSGRERMSMLRCKRCNAHPWDRHDPDCRWRDRY